MRRVADKRLFVLHASAVVLKAAVAAVLLMGLGGCGKASPPSGKVTGKVMLRGKPFELGLVQFVKADGVPVGSATLSPAGEFQFDRPLPVGKYGVAIVPIGDDAPAGAPNPKLEQSAKAIAAKYRSETTSGFTAAVKESDNAFTFEMK